MHNTHGHGNPKPALFLSGHPVSDRRLPVAIKSVRKLLLPAIKSHWRPNNCWQQSKSAENNCHQQSVWIGAGAPSAAPKISEIKQTNTYKLCPCSRQPEFIGNRFASPVSRRPGERICADPVAGSCLCLLEFRRARWALSVARRPV